MPRSYRRTLMATLRSLANIHILAKFTTHTEITLEELDQQVAVFDNAYAVRDESKSTGNSDLNLLLIGTQKLVEQHPTIGVNYPKLHSLSHLVDIIRRKGTTDNYHTGLGEALHPQSKKDYRHTNH